MREFFGEEQVIHAYSVESIKRATGLDVDTRIATQRLQTIYQHTVAISKQLSIKTPLILVTKLKDQRAYRYTFLDDNDDPKGDIVYVSLQGTPRMIHSLAHELRHCWQEYNAEGYFKGYVESKTRDPAYLEQKEEIDADAYASLYLNSLGYDGISMAFESNEEYLEPYWKDYITRIKKRMDEISLEMAEDSVAQ